MVDHSFKILWFSVASGPCDPFSCSGNPKTSKVMRGLPITAQKGDTQQERVSGKN